MDSECRFATMDRRDFLRLGGAGLAGAALLGTAGGRVLARTASSLKEQFETAAREYKVPVELLLAMGYYNTLWEMPPTSASTYRKGGGYGDLRGPADRRSYRLGYMPHDGVRRFSKVGLFTGVRGRVCLRTSQARRSKKEFALLRSRQASEGAIISSDGKA